jgi:hypothetical protein
MVGFRHARRYIHDAPLSERGRGDLAVGTGRAPCRTLIRRSKGPITAGVARG